MMIESSAESRCVLQTWRARQPDLQQSEMADYNNSQKALQANDVNLELNEDVGKQDFSKDENEERGNWSGRLDFLLSCLGYAVGLGNVWRFPYLCYRNGGGAFLIPYVIMMVFVGMPIFFMELSLGQFSSNGPLTCWKFAPFFGGIGIGMTIVSALVAIYYNMIIAWSLFYTFASFTSYLPWQDCDREWNTGTCYDKIPDMKCNTPGLLMGVNGTCLNATTNMIVGLWDETKARNDLGIKRKSASEEYFNNYMLGISDGFEDFGFPRWQLILCLLLAWVIVFLCLSKGVKSSGKVVYFTALFPYIVLIILLIRGVLLDGHLDGIRFYIIPRWETLTDAKVWIDAAVQIFFSLSACWGGLITLSSYNRFHNNVLRDSIIVSLGNCLTSFFAGFVIFSFLGFQAKQMHTTVDKVATSGAGLAFIVYPDAVTRMPISPLWAVLFFVMLLTLGLDSQFTLCETVVTALLDRFPSLRKRKIFVILTLCIVFFAIGILLTTPGGMYLLQLMDTYAGGWSVLLIGFCECIALMWVYGWERFASDIKCMTGSRPSLWWRMCWQFLTPAIILFVLFFSWIDYSPARYGEYYFPIWADAIGWVMSVSVIIAIPLVMLYALCKYRGIRNATTPTVEWGPALEKHRRLVTYVPGFVYNPTDNPSEWRSAPSLNNQSKVGKENPAYDATEVTED